MLWVKAFHIIAMVAWFAGLFYLPRLFVYHTEINAHDEPGYQRFCTMERRLFWGIMTPSSLITLLLGIGLVHMMHHSFTAPPLWLGFKLALVGLLVVFHGYCGWCVKQFAHHQNRHTTSFYRKFNEIPSVLLMLIVLLVVIKPT